MTGMTALLVADSDNPVPDLTAALHRERITVVRATSGQVHEQPGGYADAEVVLASAALGLRRVALLAQRVGTVGRSPTVVVFPEDDFAALEECVLGGFDYVAPPYMPGLLRSRLATCGERKELSAAVAEMAAVADMYQYERDLNDAKVIQAGFLPRRLPDSPGWEFASRFRPARQVAGDFYDGFRLVNGARLGFVVADVCDKGVGAGMFMALIRTLLRHTAEHAGGGLPEDEEHTTVTGPPLLSLGAGPLIQAVVGTNAYMARHHMEQGYFATVFFGVLDPATGSLVYINCGHNPPVLARADGAHDLLRPTGPAIGMLPSSVYSLGHTMLGRGDTLLVYTDGVIEARDQDGALFGMSRMLSATLDGPRPAECLLTAVDRELTSFVGPAEQYDDITMLALHRQVA